MRHAEIHRCAQKFRGEHCSRVSLYSGPRSRGLRGWLAELGPTKQLGIGCLGIAIIGMLTLYCAGTFSVIVRPMLFQYAPTPITPLPTPLPPTATRPPAFVPLPAGTVPRTPTQGRIPTREIPTQTPTLDPLVTRTTPSGTATNTPTATRR
jgi:hypothetical protein